MDSKPHFSSRPNASETRSARQVEGMSPLNDINQNNNSSRILSNPPVRSSGRTRRPSSKFMEMQGIPEEILSDEDDDVCANALKANRIRVDISKESRRRSRNTDTRMNPAKIRRTSTPYPSPEATPLKKRAVSPMDVISLHDSDSDPEITRKRSNAFVDDEADESERANSDIEEDLDRYESDFIDDGPIATSLSSRRFSNMDRVIPDRHKQRKRQKLGSPLFLEARPSPASANKELSGRQYSDRKRDDPGRPTYIPGSGKSTNASKSFGGRATFLTTTNTNVTRSVSPDGPHQETSTHRPRPKSRTVAPMPSEGFHSQDHQVHNSTNITELPPSEQSDVQCNSPCASQQDRDSAGEHSAHSNEARQKSNATFSRTNAIAPNTAVVKTESVQPEHSDMDMSPDEDNCVPLPDDDWLRSTYKGLPKLKYVLLEKTAKNQKERVDDSLLSPARIKACFEKNGPEYIASRLFRLLTMKHYKIYVNASRIDPSLIKASASGSSSFFNATPKMYRPSERSLSNNICFVMTGMVAYSYLTEEAVNASSYRTTVDHRLGLYPFDGEFQRAMTLFGNLAGKESLIYGFQGGVIPFTTRIKAGNEDQGNIVASPKKSGLFSRGNPSQPSGSHPLLSNIKRKHYPAPLAFDDKVPVFDARRKDRTFNDNEWDTLHRLPLWTADEVDPYCLVTVGYTANTYFISTNYSANSNSPYLSLNLQFVIVHSNPVSV